MDAVRFWKALYASFLYSTKGSRWPNARRPMPAFR